MSEHIFEQYSSQLMNSSQSQLIHNENFIQIHQNSLNDSTKTNKYLETIFTFTKSGPIVHNSKMEANKNSCVLNTTNITILWGYQDNLGYYYGKQFTSPYGFSELKLISLLNEVAVAVGVEVEYALNKNIFEWNINKLCSLLEIYQDTNENIIIMCGKF